MRSFRVVSLFVLGGSATALLLHCGSNSSGGVSQFDAGSPSLDASFAPEASIDAANASDVSIATFGSKCDSATGCIDSGGPPAVCGDGRIEQGEGCDDGNTTSGDGCSSSCLVEPGWTCPYADLKCVAAKCGDGIVAGNEQCDFPPGQPVTGCSSTCQIEPGYDCNATTLTCTQTVCGNMIVERGETCDDGNDIPFDGCYQCQKEPSCTNGVCVATCGDGQRYATEACDDGNTISGDGCSSTCQVETGYTCTDSTAAPPTSISKPVLLRDFIGYGNQIDGGVPHPDFNQLGGSGCLGIVDTQLAPGTGRPVFACPGGDCTQNPGVLYNGGGRHNNMTTPANFEQWYTNVPGVNIDFVKTITLGQQPDGTYTWDSAVTSDNDGMNYFDPIHTNGWVAAGQERLAQCSPDRNCSFTSETHFFFEYQGGEHFEFSGDDDTWVFLNNTLAIDLGGLHSQLNGHFDLDGGGDGGVADGKAVIETDLKTTPFTVDFGLTLHGVYEIVMFQAERNQCGSNFHVTLKNFNRPESVCASTCGDGIVASDEVCDDGTNDGSYDGCDPGCKMRGPYCGDGIVQMPEEQCDDGNTDPNDGCSSSCTINMPR